MKEKAKTFAELEKKETILYGEIVDSLWDYVRSGAAICGRVVCCLIERCDTPKKPDDDAWVAFMPPLRKGQENQYERYEEKAAAEYRVVIQYIKDKVGPERAKRI